MDMLHFLLYVAAGLSIAALGVIVWDLHWNPAPLPRDPDEITPPAWTALALILAAVVTCLVGYATHQEEYAHYANWTAVWMAGCALVFAIAVVAVLFRPSRLDRGRR